MACHISSPQTDSDLPEPWAQHPLEFNLGSMGHLEHGHELKGKAKTLVLPSIFSEKKSMKHLS